MKRLRHLPLVLVLAVLAAAALLTADALAELRLQHAWFSNAINRVEALWPGVDSTHVLLFFCVGVALVLALPRRPPLAALAQAMAGVVLLAALSELVQFWTPGRTPLWSDFRDDLLGGGAGVLLGVLLAKLWEGLQSRSAILWEGLQSRSPQFFRHSAGWLLLAGVLALPWMRWQAGSVFGHELLVADVLLAGALGLRLLGMAAGDALRFTRFHAWLAAYVALMALAVLTSPQVYASAGKWVGVLYLALLAGLVHDLADTELFRRRLVLVWLAATAVVVGLVLVAAAGFWLSPSLRAAVEPLLARYGSLPVGNYPRVVATFANPNMLCDYLIAGLALTLAARRLQWLPPRWGSALAGAITLAAVFTVSPGLAGIAAIWALWLGCQPPLCQGPVWEGKLWEGLQSRFPHSATAALITGLAFIALMLLATAINPADPFAQPSVRGKIWQAALQTAAAHPWLGVGLGLPVVEVFHLAPDGGMQRLTDAHNIWLNVTCQAGVFAAVALAGLLLHLAWKPTAPGPAATLRFALVLALVASWGVHGLTGSFEDARHAWLVLGLVAACAPCGRDFSPDALGRKAIGTEVPPTRVGV